MRKSLFLTLILALSLSASLVLSGPVLAQGDPLRVMASSSILADVAGRVAGDAAEVTSLIPLDADPHSYTPAPQDLVALVQADVVFVVGAGLEENLSVALEDLAADMTLVTASSCINILPFGAEAEDHADEHDHAEEQHTEAHADDSPIAVLCAGHHAELETLMGHSEAMAMDHAHDHEAGLGMLYELACGAHDDHAGEEHAGEDHHAEGSCDPHVWTDPHNVMLWALLIRDTLSELDPANAATYAANTAAYLEELHSLIEDEVEPLLATIPAQNRRLVTNHLAFSYYAQAFDLDMLGTVIPGASTLAEPSAAEVAALITAIREAGVPAVFAETTANPTLAEQVAAETGVAFYTLYTGSLSEPEGPAGTYLDYTRYNTRAITEALGGTLD